MMFLVTMVTGVWAKNQKYEDCTHVPGEPVQENVDGPYCTTGGSYDKVTYCTLCGEELSREKMYTVALGHNYNGQVCYPTCEENGYTTFTCSRCGDSYTDDYTDALGHDWGNVTYTWANDYSKVTASRTCQRDASHVDSETVQTTREETKEQTATEPGEITYTATFTKYGFTTQTKVVKTEDRTGCDSFYWSRNGTTYTASGEYTYDDGTDIYKLNLTIHNSTSEIWEREVFIGQHFNEYPFDFDVTADTPLTQTETTTNVHGCDNVITLNLTIVPGPGIDISDTETFPDDMFRSLIGTQYDTNHDGYLSDEEIAAVTRITIRDAGVTSLKGIEQFTSLKELECQGNSLSSLDLTKNTALTGLWATYNQLQELDLSKNQALELLDCGGNQLTSLDLSQNKILTELSCRDNQLTSLDVLQNTALELLYCDRNKLTALVLPKGMNRLEELFCYSNQIKDEAMTALVESLPQAFGNGLFIVIDTADNNEQNEISTDQVAEAKGKGWNVLNEDGTQYPGTTDIHSIDNGELAIDNYYTLDGRKLQAMPTVKGVYIVNGKKVVIM